MTTQARRSEYRLNYLPFDYYDFWITTKENEQLRFRNKLRDYLHTPFDWDENMGVYSESAEVVAAAAARENARLEKMNRATQTSARPNRHDQLARLVDDKKSLNLNLNLNHLDDEDGGGGDGGGKHIHVANLDKCVQTKATLMKKKCDGKINARKKSAKKEAGCCKNNNDKKHDRPTKSASIQVNLDLSKKNQDFVRSRSAAKQSRNKNNIGNKQGKDNQIARSMSNMSIQTPIQWTLRDYSRSSLKSDKGNQLKRASSVTNLQQPRRPPFANYGWAVKAKDLSQKPTHNALANKILAVKFNDENAKEELRHQRMQRQANHLANELDTKSLDRFRSESRDWASEYDEKFLDYTQAATAKKRDLYFSLNPNKFRKSSLVQDDKRKQNSSSKINFYYYE